MKTIQPFNYSGALSAPFSKSYLQRALAIALLSEEESEIHGYTPSNDALVALSAIKTLGAIYSISENTIKVAPSGIKNNKISINCGEAGLSTRMFSPIAASLSANVTINGEGSILTRPMHMIIDALEALKVNVTSNNGYLPISTSGKVSPGTIEIDGSESSQLLTGLLITLPTLAEDSFITVNNLKSTPYIQMTIDILMHYGISIHHSNFEEFQIKGNQMPRADHYNVEGDWSGASFHVVGAAISGSIVLRNLNPNSSQADIAILEAVEKAGAIVSWENDQLLVKKNQLNAFTFDATQCPDLFPPLAVLAACCKGKSIIKGTSRLTNKESNRALTIQEEFGKLGIEIVLSENEMIITGPSQITGSTIDSRNDHRIAMAGAILATQTESSISITSPDAINKSYPGFYNDLENISEVL